MDWELDRTRSYIHWCEQRDGDKKGISVVRAGQDKQEIRVRQCACNYTEREHCSQHSPIMLSVSSQDNPIASANFWKRSRCRDFVRVSATISDVGIHSRITRS